MMESNNAIKKSWKETEERLKKKAKDDNERSKAEYMNSTAEVMFGSKISSGNMAQADLSQMSRTHQSSAWIRNKSL